MTDLNIDTTFQDNLEDAFESLAEACIFVIEHVVMLKTWHSYPLADQQALRNFVAKLDEVNSTIRSEFDKVVWNGHENGTVSTTIESVRKRTEGKVPGRKAAVKTAADIFAGK